MMKTLRWIPILSLLLLTLSFTAHAKAKLGQQQNSQQQQQREQQGGQLITHHKHVHGPQCSHVKIKHGRHYDFLHNAHLHHKLSAHAYGEHALEVSELNPIDTESFNCPSGITGYQLVPHGDHRDALYQDRLYFLHGSHCEDHGSLTVQENE